jgi:hypothetical protein
VVDVEVCFVSVCGELWDGMRWYGKEEKGRMRERNGMPL